MIDPADGHVRRGIAMTKPLVFMPVRSKPGTPLYVAVRDSVHAAIVAGDIAPGQQLPSTKELSARLDVSLVTVHRALNELVSSGVLRRGQGRGTFVHEDFAKPGHIAGDARFGVVFHPESTLADPYHGRVLQGVRDASRAHGVDLVLLRYGEDWRKECAGYLYVNPFPEQVAHSPRFGAGRFGGAQLASGRTAEGRAVAAAEVPLVGIGVNPSVWATMSVVDTDNVAMMREAVALLFAAGHRRIAYLGDGSRASNSVDRERGFHEGCAIAGLTDADVSIMRSGGWRTGDADAAQLTERLIGPARPTAIVAGGYYLALDVYAAAKRAGLELPTDLSVIGVDDPPSAAYLSPPMTTFRQPLEEIGRAAVDLLWGLVLGTVQRGESRVLRGELIERESVAAPAGAWTRTRSEPLPAVAGTGRVQEARHATGE